MFVRVTSGYFFARLTSARLPIQPEFRFSIEALEKHHLFPKAHMKAQGYTDAKINQMANYAFIDWKDNMDILDDAPSVYYPIVCEGRSDEEILRMEEENALPHGWENMPYEDFLVERRKLMAAKIKQAFDLLKKNVE